MARVFGTTSSIRADFWPRGSLWKGRRTPRAGIWWRRSKPWQNSQTTMTIVIETKINEHTIPSLLLEKTVRITVVACGGTGSAVASGLPYLHQAMRALGHPGGLDVTLVDGDRVSRINCVRQPFSDANRSILGLGLERYSSIPRRGRARTDRHCHWVCGVSQSAERDTRQPSLLEQSLMA
jgi:hypothetical protein